MAIKLFKTTTNDKSQLSSIVYRIVIQTLATIIISTQGVTHTEVTVISDGDS